MNFIGEIKMKGFTFLELVIALFGIAVSFCFYIQMLLD